VPEPHPLRRHPRRARKAGGESRLQSAAVTRAWAGRVTGCDSKHPAGCQHDAAGVLHRRQQVDGAAVAVGWVGAAQRLAIDGHRPLPWPLRGGGVVVAVACDQPVPTAAARAWASSRPRVRRMVASVGTRKPPASGSWRAPSAARIGWGCRRPTRRWRQTSGRRSAPRRRPRQDPAAIERLGGLPCPWTRGTVDTVACGKAARGKRQSRRGRPWMNSPAIGRLRCRLGWWSACGWGRACQHRPAGSLHPGVVGARGSRHEGRSPARSS
jgi:hypothetical protein